MSGASVDDVFNRVELKVMGVLQENAQLREQNRVLRGLVVHVEQIEADLHAALNGTRHDPSWIRPIQLSRNERQELYLGCIKDLQALKAALTATSQPAKPQGRMHACDIPGCVSCGNPEDATSQEPTA